MKSLLLVAALLSSTAGAAFAELQSSPGLPGGLILGANGHGQLYFDPNAGIVRAVPGTVIGPNAAGRFLNPRAPGGPQRVGRALTNTDEPLAVLALPFTGAGTLVDIANPFSGDGFGSRGTVGRGLTSTGIIMPGRFIGGPEGSAAVGASVGSGIGAVFGGPPGFFVGGVAGSLVPLVDYVNPFSGDGYGSYGNAGRSLGLPYIRSLDPIVQLDTLNPWSGDGVGSPGVVGRGLVPYGAGQQVVVPGRWLTETGDGIATWVEGIGLGAVAGGLALPTVMTGPFLASEALAASAPLLAAGAAGGLTLGIDALNPWSGDGVGSRGAAGRGLVPYGAGQQVVVPGRWLTGTAGGIASQVGAAGVAEAGLLLGSGPASLVPILAGLGAVVGGAGTFAVDLVNPWSGDGVGSRGAAGRGLGVPGGVAGQVPIYSTGNAGMAPVQYDVGPQGTTISITIPNGYNLGQMGMTPMVPAMSAPQYRVIPQYAAPAPVAYAAPAPVAYAAPATPANAAVAPAAANAGVKCQVGDQQAVALTVDACEEAGGLVQSMDAAQAAE